MGERLGGNQPMKVIFFPETGQTKVKKLRSMHNDTIIEREVGYQSELSHEVTTDHDDDVEFFD